MENKEENKFECIICLSAPTNPVATTCGHVFCWKCLQGWVSGKTTLQCPVCKNGLDMQRVIPLYTSSTNSTNEKDDRPKSERIPPVQQRTSFVF
jgi:hypothetical protein